MILAQQKMNNQSAYDEISTYEMVAPPLPNSANTMATIEPATITNTSQIPYNGPIPGGILKHGSRRNLDGVAASIRGI
jgi:hypothetical protein